MSEEIFSPDREQAPPSLPTSASNSPAPKSIAPVVRRRSRWGLWIAIVVVLLAAIGGGAWWWRRPQVDWETVYAQNNHGIAVMEGYHYIQAIPEFEKVVKMAPDWLPGRINLGIALLNAGGDDPTLLPRCKATFEEVLRREPDNPHAHFCLGILLRYQKDGAEAAKHFEAVLKKDPNDAYSWYWLGSLKTPNSAEQSRCFDEALKRNRHLRGALYGLNQNLRRTDLAAADKLLDEFTALEKAHWLNESDVKYSQMGPLAEVIGCTDNSPAKPRIRPASPLPAPRVAEGATCPRRTLGEGFGLRR